MLSKNKLNIFSRDSKDKMPIDYIPKDDIEEYVNMVADSYDYVLKNYNYVWSDDWENICSKKMIDEKMTKDEIDVLMKQIIHDKQNNIKNKEYGLTNQTFNQGNKLLP